MATAQAFDIPARPAARVNDYAGVIDAGARGALEAKLAEFEHASSTQIVVVTVPTLDGAAIEDVTARTLETWGLGQKSRNNGVLLLVAVQDRRARIEVGYGLEDKLTDALSRRILEDRLFPLLRQGNYGAGIAATCDGIIQATQGAFVATPRKKQDVSWLPVVLPLLILIVFLIIGLQGGGQLGGGGRRRTWRTGPIWWGGGGWGGGGGGGLGGWGGGGGGGGGFGGFSGGGGMSGGGGASGSW